MTLSVESRVLSFEEAYGSWRMRAFRRVGLEVEGVSQ